MYDVEVLDYAVDGTTGLIDVVVRAVSTENGVIRQGPIRKYFVDATELKSKYNGEALQWLQYVKREHQAHHGLHAVAVEQLAAMKGKKI